MTAQETLREAERRGVVLTPKGTSLHFRGPKAALNDELKSELKRHKPEILVLLRGHSQTYPCTRCEMFAFPEAETVCYWCRKVRHEA